MYQEASMTEYNEPLSSAIPTEVGRVLQHLIAALEHGAVSLGNPMVRASIAQAKAALSEGMGRPTPVELDADVADVKSRLDSSIAQLKDAMDRVVSPGYRGTEPVNIDIEAIEKSFAEAIARATEILERLKEPLAYAGDSLKTSDPLAIVEPLSDPMNPSPKVHDIAGASAPALALVATSGPEFNDAPPVTERSELQGASEVAATSHEAFESGE